MLQKLQQEIYSCIRLSVLHGCGPSIISIQLFIILDYKISMELEENSHGFDQSDSSGESDGEPDIDQMLSELEGFQVVRSENI